MNAWQGGVVLLLMVGSPTIVPIVVRRIGWVQPGEDLWSTIMKNPRPRPRPPSRRADTIGRIACLAVLVGTGAALGWELTQDQPRHTGNQMDHGSDGLPPWAAYPLGAALLLGCVRFGARDTFAGMFTARRKDTPKLDAPAEDDGWKPESERTSG